MTTTYYIVTVDGDGDVLAIDASCINREGLAITVQSDPRATCSFENQGPSHGDKWSSAQFALAAIMPSDDES